MYFMEKRKTRQERKRKVVNDNIEFLEELLSNFNTLEDKIYFLELKERQRYNYYCDCGCNFSREEDIAFHEVWDWIICKIKELKQEKEKV